MVPVIPAETRLPATLAQRPSPRRGFESLRSGSTVWGFLAPVDLNYASYCVQKIRSGIAGPDWDCKKTTDSVKNKRAAGEREGARLTSQYDNPLQKSLELQGFDKDGSKKPVKSRLCGQQQAMRQLKLNKFTGQGYRFHQWYPFSVAPR